MAFKKGDRVIFKMSREVATVHSIEGEKARLNMRDDLGGFMQEAHVDHLQHIFDYEQIVVDMPENDYYGDCIDIYRDKRTGLAVFDKQQYEAWITENGL